MSRFTTAFQTWLTHRQDISLRQVALDAGIDTSALSLFRSGKRPITFDALSKLLPAIEKHSNRTEALTLHVAYLLDEVVAGYEQDLTITPIDPQTSTTRVDSIDMRARKWAKKARKEADFEEMWASLDRFIIGTDEVIADLTIEALSQAEAAKRKATAFPEVDTSILNEDPSSYGTTHQEVNEALREVIEQVENPPNSKTKSA